jgi:hypothetical protein
MIRFAQFTIAALLMAGLSFGQQSAKEDMKDAGTAIKNAGKETGRAAKKVGKGHSQGRQQGRRKDC